MNKVTRDEKLSWCSNGYNIATLINDLGLDMRPNLASSLHSLYDRIVDGSLEGHRTKAALVSYMIVHIRVRANLVSAAKRINGRERQTNGREALTHPVCNCQIAEIQFVNQLPHEPDWDRRSRCNTCSNTHALLIELLVPRLRLRLTVDD